MDELYNSDDAVQKSASDVPNQRYVRCSKSHAIKFGVAYCGVCGRPPVVEELERNSEGRGRGRRRQPVVEDDEFANLTVLPEIFFDRWDPRTNTVESSVLGTFNLLDIKESEPESSSVKKEPKAAGRFDISRDYLDCGLRRCAQNHYFPAGRRNCLVCVGPPIEENVELDAAFLLDYKEDDEIQWETKGKDLQDFGLLVCVNGHTFHKTLFSCNICGMNTKGHYETHEKLSEEVVRRERKETDPKIKGKHRLLTPGYFYVPEPIIFPNGWTTTPRPNQNNGADNNGSGTSESTKNAAHQKVDHGCMTSSPPRTRRPN